MLYTFHLDINWQLVNELSQIDRFGGEWSSIVAREGQSLKQLKSIATVRSVGSSTRIEGSKMTDTEVEVLIENLKIEKLEDRDQQEVVGYFEALDLISYAYQNMPISENTLKSLHNSLMKYSDKDQWHKGGYKQHANSVEATGPDGDKNIIFNTPAPGWPTEDAMRLLLEWYNQEKEAHPLVRIAVFVYDFLSIHPFQDGNGRLSRLLATLLLLKADYGWIEYVSFEHEIETRKSDYYKVLMECQRNRPGEKINPWVVFFTTCLSNIQQQLKQKLETKTEEISISPRVRQIRMYVEHHGGSRTGEIAVKLGLPLPTVKKEVAAMVSSGMLVKHGVGAGTHYTARPRLVAKPDRMLKLGKKEFSQTFQLMQPGSSRAIKKIVLTPLFDWVQPDEWVDKLHRQGLYVFIQCSNRKGDIFSRQYLIGAYNHPYLFQPVFALNNPIIVPDTIMDRTVYQYEYPVQVEIALRGSVDVAEYAFDVLLVYDERE